MDIWGGSFRGAPLRTQKTLKTSSENASKIDKKNIKISQKNACFWHVSRYVFDAFLLFFCYFVVVFLTFFWPTRRTFVELFGHVCIPFVSPFWAWPILALQKMCFVAWHFLCVFEAFLLLVFVVFFAFFCNFFVDFLTISVVFCVVILSLFLVFFACFCAFFHTFSCLCFLNFGDDFSMFFSKFVALLKK